MLMMAGTESLRKQNRGLVLSALRRLGAVSHTEIAGWTGLSSATVSTITHELEDDHIIKRVEQAPPSGRGRPRVLLIQNPEAAYIAVIRINSEMVEYSLVDYAGTLKDRFSEARPPEESDPSIFSVRFINGLERLIRRGNLLLQQLLMISISTKGLVAEGKAELSWSPVFESQPIDFHALLSDRWPCNITLTNDTQYAAQSILQDRSKKSGHYAARKLAVLSLSHSIGLGIATEDLSGRISAVAPPFGHMVHRMDGPVCRCGALGCIESYAGFYGILRTAFGVKDDVIPAKFIPFPEVEKIAAQARAGDNLSEYAFRMAGEAIGVGVGRMLTLFGPMPIAITGQGIHNYDLMEKPIRDGIARNLQIRHNSMPEITLHFEEGQLIYEGNVQTCLNDLDKNVLSERNDARSIN